ncbi:MAG: substrate-binding domain-containing protein [Clostridiales bacterium]|nr:substrate-binding domain-containing protein [Clostridiales bacterium]
MEPKYQAVAESLRHDIATGLYRDGEALLTEVELKQKFGVSRQTVRQAISLLENDGLVIRRRGSGTYVNHGARKHGGVLSVGVITTYITDYIFPSIVRGVESALSAENCIMSLSATYNRTDHERSLLQRILESPLDGLIVEGTKTALPNPNTGLYEQLWERNIPCVFINGYYPQLPNAVYVVTDDESGGRMAAAYLAERGFTRVGGIFKSDDMQGHLRYQGFSGELQDRGLRVRDDAVCWFSTENKRRFLRDETGAEFIRSLKNGLEAVVCYNDEIAVELLEVLREHHISVPRDVSLVSFDNSAYAAVCHPKLTSLAHPKDEFGRVAAEKLLNMMAGKRESSIVLPWTMIERDSVR